MSVVNLSQASFKLCVLPELQTKFQYFLLQSIVNGHVIKVYNISKENSLESS